MHSSTPGAWLTEIAAPLTERFGAELTLSRSGTSVCWGYDGQSAVIEMMPGGSLVATFVDVTGIDAVCGRPAAAAYRGRATYSLNRPGATRMVADLVDFFSGVREPNFTFIDAYPR